ncbi:methyltransferase [Pseudidiomarina taiwanensis]|uniref:Uncharacterized protein n=1 Tax=Pseudidiomarina taiwanensis TaxID=337250 RepID=A0A432ZNY9_9GAMM|nr:methyltransferase [Pseudidiomarina taiwanensis]RUO79604.1 hypothetical protein CWI83_03665 [Pseudidiomarina taiwanensis]
MPNTEFSTALGNWQLYRYPKRRNETLQAWDAGDLLLLERLAPIITGKSPRSWVVVNDQCGALSLPLCALKQTVYSLNDSYVSDCAVTANLEHNQIATPVQVLDPTELNPVTAEQVLLKVPKSQSLLDYQLLQLSQRLPVGTPIMITGKSALFTPNMRSRVERYLTEPEYSLIQRKHRVLMAKLRRDSTAANFIEAWQCPVTQLQLQHYPGVFARQQLDIGARFLLDHLPAPGARHVIDLGCGNGVLGLAYAKLSPASEVTWVDQSKLALASCQLNIEANLGNSAQYQTQLDDCLQHQASQTADLILCNPPFHQEHAVTEHIALQMFRDAHRVLERGGVLVVVANRHLPYYRPLKGLFRSVAQLGAHPKFTIYCATK